MNRRSNDTLIGRALEWVRGYFNRPGGSQESASGSSRQDTSGRESEPVLGDLADSDRSANAQDGATDRSAGLADGGRFDNRAASGRAASSGAGDDADADVERQGQQPGGSTGASADEYGAGGYPATHPDQDDVEDAAESDADRQNADDADMGSSSAGMDASNNTSVTGATGGTDWVVGGSTSAAEDSGSLAARGIDDSGETDMSGAGGTSAASGIVDLDDAAGDNEAGVSDYLGGSGDMEEADTVHDAVGGEHRTDDESMELDEGLTDRSGVVDQSMEGDTDYVVSGYPSESLDIDIEDTDDVGVYDADSIDDNEGDDDGADFSEDTGTLGLTDSETVEVGDTDTDAASPLSPATEDIGVGGPDEVDDDSMITAEDNATSFGDADVGDYGPGGAGESEVGEGMQSYASTADRNVLADIQDASPESTAAGPETVSPEIGGLGSDESPADDPTSLGIDPNVGSGDRAGTANGSAVTGTTSGTGVSTGSEPVAAPSGGTGDQTYAGAVRGDRTAACPADYPIKGNASSKIYHVPGRASYDATIAEWCFATEEDAVNAGFRAPKR